MTKYGIDRGHGCENDGGAVGLVREERWINEVGAYLTQYLQQLGHETVQLRPESATSDDHSLQQRCDRANETKCDVFVSIHANKFNGKAHGTEIYAISKAATTIAKPVLEEICKLGFFDRGIKQRPRFAVLRRTKMPAILIEIGFIDSPKDVGLFNAIAVAKAICKGLTGEYPD
jgi:N-acetylmuramoyl-L-alanine amidase